MKNEQKLEEKKGNPIKIENNPSINLNNNLNNNHHNLHIQHDFAGPENNFEKSKMKLLQTIDSNSKKVNDRIIQ